MNIIIVSIALIGATSGLRLPKISPYVKECPKDEPLDFFPHDTDCTLFYICSHGTLTVTECPDDLHFNPVAKVKDIFFNSYINIDEFTDNRNICDLFFTLGM